MVGLRCAMADELGISLSGGGLRAASFGLGCLQALDARAGVLAGPRAARYLAAVSGGSYTAAAVSLHASRELSRDLQVFRDQRPFAPGSDEAVALSQRCAYLRDLGPGRLATTLVKYLAGGLMTGASALLWFPVIFGMLGRLSPSIPEPWLTVFGCVGLGYVAFVVWWVINRTPNGGDARRSIPWSLAMLVLAFPTGSIVRETDGVIPPHWIASHPGSVLSALGLGLLACVIGSWYSWSPTDTRRSPGAVLLAGLAIFVLRTLQLTTVIVLLWSCAWFAGDPEGPGASDASILAWAGIQGAIAIAILGFGGYVLFYGAGDSTTPHGFYSSLVASCFSLSSRTESVIEPTPLDIPLTSVRPPLSGDGRFPELLICTAANIHTRTAPVSSLVMSPVNSRLHSDGRTHEVKTGDLERFTYPDRMNLAKTRRIVTLFRAVGLSGAAVAPTMGYKTVRAVSGILALLNIRLGRWLPNPSGDLLKDLPAEGDIPLLPAARDVFRELAGHSPADSPVFYITDGGHYENLGIVELLRRQCPRIVAIDASLGPDDDGSALAHSLRLAQRETHTSVDVDITAFHRDRKTGLLNRCWVLGTSHFPDGTEGRVLVVRLGIDSETPAPLRAMASRVPRFPYTSTANQFYNATMFDAYVDLGRACVENALQERTVRAFLTGLDGRDATEEDPPES
jgi:hypothetical protein